VSSLLNTPMPSTSPEAVWTPWLAPISC
jgi:hypothetical protein